MPHSARACAEYFIANYYVERRRAPSPEVYQRHRDALATRIQDTVDRYLNDVAPEEAAPLLPERNA